MLVMSQWLNQTTNIQYYIDFFHMHLCPGHFEKGFSTNGLRNTTFFYILPNPPGVHLVAGETMMHCSIMYLQKQLLPSATEGISISD